MNKILNETSVFIKNLQFSENPFKNENEKKKFKMYRYFGKHILVQVKLIYFLLMRVFFNS